jgi:hypothetical protein
MNTKQLSSELLRKLGYTAGNVETTNKHNGNTVDLFGFGDILAFHPESKIHLNSALIVQACGTGDFSNHVKKYFRNAETNHITTNIINWLRAGNGFEIWAWHNLTRSVRNKLKAQGKIPENKNPMVIPRVYRYVYHCEGLFDGHAEISEQYHNIYEVEGSEIETLGYTLPYQDPSIYSDLEPHHSSLPEHSLIDVITTN